ncbi:MAG: hypothetical protein FGM14_12395 [Flavobacteriales bacterium]|nr:hypothetical protein [Flavobacteriales bacterium]
MENGFLDFNMCIGSKIKKCFRNFSNRQNDEIPVEKRLQESDGEIIIELSNGDFYLFSPDSENFSIKIDKIIFEEKNNLFIDVSSDLFWQNRLDVEIINISKLYSKFRDIHFGIKITLSNNISFKIIYESENEFDFDLILIKDGLFIEAYER